MELQHNSEKPERYIRDHSECRSSLSLLENMYTRTIPEALITLHGNVCMEKMSLSRRAVVGILFTLLLIAMLNSASNIKTVGASGTINIRIDGSVDPSDAPIETSDNVTYTFNADINDSIVVERDNIVIDGSGLTLLGDRRLVTIGIDLSERRGVVIRNMTIGNFTWGIYLASSSNNIISDNVIMDNTATGIRMLESSSNNTISRNQIVTTDALGIYLLSSFNNTFYQNTIKGSSDGMNFEDGSSFFNDIHDNNITSNAVGIRLSGISNNKIYHNNFINNGRHLLVQSTPGTNIWDYGSANGGNYWSGYTGMDADGDGIGDSPIIIDVNNIDRYPLMEICKPWRTTGISVSTSPPSTLLGFMVNITGSLSDANKTHLEDKAVSLFYTSGDNPWFLISSDKTDQFGLYSVQWIPPATGYFQIMAQWAGNVTHLGASNSTTLNTLPYQNRYVFSVESNSTISELSFNTTSQELSFVATGPTGTNGYVKITLAKSLVSDATGIKVYVDNESINYSVKSFGDSWLLLFEYLHSSHTVTLVLNLDGFSGTTFLGLEWWIWVVIIVMISAMIITIAAVLAKRKH